MSGFLDKAKDALGKAGGSGGSGSTGSTTGTGQQSSVEKQGSGYLNKGIDQATDQAGLGDKYDEKINKFADGQLDKQIPGGKN